LKSARARKRLVAETTIHPENLLPLDQVERKFLPVLEGQVERPVIEEESRIELDRILSTLPYKQEQIIRDIYGIGTEKKTREELTQKYGTSLARIYQIGRIAIQKLRHPSRARALTELIDTF